MPELMDKETLLACATGLQEQLFAKKLTAVGVVEGTLCFVFNDDTVMLVDAAVEISLAQGEQAVAVFREKDETRTKE